MKKLLCILFITLLSITLYPTFSFAQYLPNEVIVTVPSANVRQTPSLSGKVIATKKSRDVMTMLSQQKDWYNVQVDAKTTGWIHNSTVRLNKPTPDVNRTFLGNGYFLASDIPLFTSLIEPKEVLRTSVLNETFIVVHETSNYFCILLGNERFWVEKSDKLSIQPNNVVWISVNSANVWDQSFTTTISAIPYGTILSVLKTTKDAYEIDINGSKGWIKRSDTTANSTNWLTSVYISDKNATVYTKPTTSSTVLTTLPVGSSFAIHAVTSTMVQIDRGNGNLGWISRSKNLTSSIFNDWLLQTETTETPLQGKTIVIDAGHGNHDTGAIGSGKTYEKNLNLAVALQLESQLQMLGANVVMTRRTDIFLPLEVRAAFSKKVNADLFISVHHNSATPKAAGFEVHYLKSNSFTLAKQMNYGLQQALKTPNRGLYNSNFSVLRNNTIPAVLLEIGFVSNPSELKILNSPTTHANVAISLSNTIMQYFS
ncbi:MAG: N-acetylmuramoyl-L-alanine amidase [Bacilli bacterium]